MAFIEANKTFFLVGESATLTQKRILTNTYDRALLQKSQCFLDVDCFHEEFQHICLTGSSICL